MDSAGLTSWEMPQDANGNDKLVRGVLESDNTMNDVSGEALKLGSVYQYDDTSDGDRKLVQAGLFGCLSQVE